MEFISKFNVGDKVYTVDKETMKIKEITIETVVAISSEINKVRVSYSLMTEGYRTESYDEAVCFASREELIDYMTSPAE